MTNEEAIKTIEMAIAEVEWNYPMNYAIAFETAISALEKQIPKKPLLQDMHDGYNGLLDHLYNCPICHEFICYATELRIEEKFAYCPSCGQAIDWSNESEELL